MTLWLIFGLMTAAAIFAVIWPLAHHANTARSGSDIVVYRDQLDEIERDLAAGLIGKTEAQAARVEISRRLLAAADAARTMPADSNPKAAVWRRRAVGLVSLLLLPVGAGGLYLRLGSPELASHALAAQQEVPSAVDSSVGSLITKVEAHLERNPKDGHGWEVLAPVYLQLGRYTDSVKAWRNVLQLLGENADRQANLGEALMAEANGIVTADAKAAFVRALTLDSTTVSARYYLGIAAEQDGQRDKAADIFRHLIAEAPAGAPWVSNVRAALARVEGKAPPKSPGLNAAQMAVAGKQPPEQQSTMIRGMVDRLAARLKKDGSDLDGWVRLVRSYKVLGEPDKATAAAADARQALAGDTGKLQQLETALKDIAAGKTASAAPAASPAQTPKTATPPDHQQGAAIQSMVERLAERLKKSGSDPDGWLMLTRSYLTLGEKDKATTAIRNARRALADDPNKLAQFNTALKNFKIDD